MGCGSWPSGAQAAAGQASQAMQLASWHPSSLTPNRPHTRPSQIEPYIALEEFTPEAVSKVSRACTSICMWVRAMHLYNTVALSVAPKRAALAAAQATLDKTLAELAEAQVGREMWRLHGCSQHAFSMCCPLNKHVS